MQRLLLFCSHILGKMPDLHLLTLHSDADAYLQVTQLDQIM